MIPVAVARQTSKGIFGCDCYGTVEKGKWEAVSGEHSILQTNGEVQGLSVSSTSVVGDVSRSETSPLLLSVQILFLLCSHSS